MERVALDPFIVEGEGKLHQIMRLARTCNLEAFLKEAVTKLMNCVNQGTRRNANTYNHVMQWCSKEKDLEAVKQVLDSAKDNQMAQGLHVANMLLKCYMECGRLESAQELFNTLLKKSTITWNKMIVGCVKCEQAEGAVEIYKQMFHEVGQQDAITYLNDLKACASPTAFKWGKDTHKINDGFQAADARVANALVRMYVKTGFITDAKQVESDGVTHRRNAYSRSNIGGLKCYSQFIRSTMNRHEERSSRSNNGGEGKQAASDHPAQTHLPAGSTLKAAVANLMDRVYQGTRVNSDAYKYVLQWCSKEKDLESVKQVHNSVKNSQMEQDLCVANMLLKCYMECGRLETAQKLFNKLLKKSTITWNMMIAGCVKHDEPKGAIEMYKQMRSEGGQPDAITYLSVLKACASPTALKWGKDIHAHLLKEGLQADVRVANALVQMYAKTGLIADAKLVFDKMRNRDVISWNVMIGALAKQGLGHEAFSLFLKMQREGIVPNVITYVSILNPCSSAGAKEWLMEVHAHALQAGLDVDVRLATSLVRMYASIGLMADAKRVFNKMRIRDIICWTVMIGGLAEQGLGQEAFSLFLEMQREGITPDAITYVSILNPCSSAGCVEWLKEVHAHASVAGLDVDLRVATSLVQMYAKAGLIADAKQVFDKMRGRNVISWNMMIGGFAEHGLGHEAFSLFLEMQKEGIAPNAITYLNILNPCSSAGAVEWLHEIYTHALEAGLDDDVRVGNAIVQMYAKTGLIANAKQVFDNMRSRDEISWNVMISGLAEQGLGRKAFSLFLEMQREGIAPDEITYLSILNPCSSAGAVEWLKEVHAHALKAGLDVDGRLATALVQMYAKTGLITDAKQVFIKMRIRDVISWTVMIGGLAEQGLGHEAFSLFLEMRKEGITPDAITFVSILNPCSSAGAVEWLKEVHAHALEAGLDVDVRVGNALVQMYAKIGLIADAKQVFDKMPIRNLISWNVMIGGLAEQGLGQEAFSLFLEMQKEEIAPNAITYLSILNPCSSPGAVEWLKDVHTHALETGLDVDVRVGTAFVQMYAKTGFLVDAKQMFDKMQIRDIISWNVMIGGLAEQGFGHEAFSLFLEMHREGIASNAITYLSILNPCSSEGAVDWLKEVHAHALEAGLDDDVRVGNALVRMYAKTGLIADAKQVFDKMRIRDVISWTVMIGGLAEQGLGHEAFSLFLEMQREGITPDAITFVSILNPCSSAGAVEWLKEVHAHALEAGLDNDVRVGNALVQMYAKTGLIADAKQVFDKMQSRNVISWTVMIGGLAQHGLGREALQLFEEMESEGFKPDDFTFVAVLSACSHAGLVEEGRSQFDSMVRDYGIEPDLGHYNCVVDMLGRAGRLKEAHFFILNMPVKPDVVTWMTFLGACRTHHNVDLAELAAAECMKLRPTDAASNVLLSNVYASVGSWEQVSSIRRMS